MATKEEIMAAAKTRFATKEVEIAAGVKVVLRELSVIEEEALDRRLWQRDKDDQPLISTEAGKRLKVAVVGSHYVEEWLAATMTPAFTVTELLDSAWPNSLKASLVAEAQKLNGYTIADAVGNS
jgi:hypothetical protein